LTRNTGTGKNITQENLTRSESITPMGTILPFLKSDLVFGPDETQILSTAFDQACQALRLSERAARERETVAIRIIELARRGERDPAKLSAHVVRDAGAV
jgi:hypothetical protein